MDDEQFKAAMEKENPTFEEIDNIAKERNRKSEEENKSELERIKREEEQRIKDERAQRGANNLLDNFYNDLKRGDLADMSEGNDTANPSPKSESDEKQNEDNNKPSEE